MWTRSDGLMSSILAHPKIIIIYSGKYVSYTINDKVYVGESFRDLLGSLIMWEKFRGFAK